MKMYLWRAVVDLFADKTDSHCSLNWNSESLHIHSFPIDLYDLKHKWSTVIHSECIFGVSHDARETVHLPYIPATASAGFLLASYVKWNGMLMKI